MAAAAGIQLLAVALLDLLGTTGGVLLHDGCGNHLLRIRLHNRLGHDLLHVGLSDNPLHDLLLIDRGRNHPLHDLLLVVGLRHDTLNDRGGIHGGNEPQANGLDVQCLLLTERLPLACIGCDLGEHARGLHGLSQGDNRQGDERNKARHSITYLSLLRILSELFLN